MDVKALALSLGLPETATQEEIQAKIMELSEANKELNQVKKQNEQMALAAITTAVETAISERRLSADRKEQFITLGQKIGLEDLKSTLSAMSPAVKITNFIQGGAAAPGADGSYQKLSEVPESEIANLKENDKETYIRLFRAEYGFTPNL